MAQIVLAFVLGVMVAATISLIAGSRRSSSVVDRFFDLLPPYDALIYSESGELVFEDIRAMPDVERADIVEYLAFGLNEQGASHAQVVQEINGSVLDFSVRDPTTRVLRGRRPTADNEATVNEDFEREFGLSVGDTVPVRAFAPDQFAEVMKGIPPRGPDYEFVIVGVVQTPHDIAFNEIRSPRVGAEASNNEMAVPIEFWEAHHSEFLDFGVSVAVQLRPDTSVDTFMREIGDMLGPDNDLQGGPVLEDFKQESAFQTPVDLETRALLAVGIGAAIGALLLSLLLLRLQQRAFDDDQQILRTLGMTANQQSIVGCLRVVPAATGAAVIAIVVATVSSDRYPIGLGRQLELDRGLQFDVVVVVTCAVAAVVLMLSTAAMLARSSLSAPVVVRSRRSRPGARVSVVAPLEVSLGYRLAFGIAGGRSRAWRWRGIAGAVLGVATFVGLGVYVGGADGLYREPGQRGWMWDLAIGNSNFTLDSDGVAELQRNPLIAGSTPIRFGLAAINSSSAEVLAFDSRSSALPSVIGGRLPVSADEIALGAGLMRQFEVEVGDAVTLSLKGSDFAQKGGRTTDLRMTVVGQSMAPALGDADIARIGVITLDAIVEAGGDPSPNIVLANVAGSDHQASIEKLAATHTEDMRTDIVPAQIVNMTRVRSVPIVGLLLAGAFALLAIGTTIVAASRSNLHTLAVLVALGLDSSGARRARAWHGIIVAAITLAIGVPLGLAAGSALWRKVTGQLGVRSTAPVTSFTVVGIVIAITLTAVGTAILTSLLRRRSNLATVLRTE